MQIKCKAGLWKIPKDHQGEIALTLKVPQLEARQVVLIPEETELDLTVEWEGNDE